MKKSLSVLLCSLCFCVLFVSCSDDDESSNEIVTPELNVQLRVGSETLTEGDTYTINGTSIKVDAARFYLGDLEFSGDNNVVQNNYYVVGGDNKTFNFEPIEEGTYAFSFAIGVDSETNDQTTDDFASRPEGDPLAAQEPSMHWNWSTGYKFLRIDATVDTNGDGVVDTPIQYHLGNDPYYALLDANAQVNLSSEDRQITIRFDLAGLLTDVDIASGASTHVGDNPALADQILDNYTTAFSLIN